MDDETHFQNAVDSIQRNGVCLMGHITAGQTEGVHQVTSIPAQMIEIHFRYCSDNFVQTAHNSRRLRECLPNQKSGRNQNSTPKSRLLHYQRTNRRRIQSTRTSTNTRRRRSTQNYHQRKITPNLQGKVYIHMYICTTYYILHTDIKFSLHSTLRFVKGEKR